MRIGIPKEIKNHEYRVAITPAGVHELVTHGHEIVIEVGAGIGSSIPDADFINAGAVMLDTADAVWEMADMILKVKEPIAAEYHRMREGQVIFTYLHLAASQGLDAAQCSLGDAYMDGHGVARDPDEAMRWWMLAGAQDHPAACCTLGSQYMAIRDVAEAKSWYQRAHDAGHPTAQLLRFSW